MWIRIAPRHEHNSKALRCGMCSQGISLLPAQPAFIG